MDPRTMLPSGLKALLQTHLATVKRQHEKDLARECAHLRVKDVDFGANQIVVRHGKGAPDRYAAPRRTHDRRATTPPPE